MGIDSIIMFADESIENSFRNPLKFLQFLNEVTNFVFQIIDRLASSR